MFLKNYILYALAICSLVGFSSANAYTISTNYETKHYAVYEVLLGKGEVYNDDLKQILSKDMLGRNKFQITAAIFPYNSDGLKGTIKEKMLGIITTEHYDQKKPVSIKIDDNAQYASYAGIYLGFKQFARIVDNRNLQKLATELAALPLVIYDVPVNKVSRDYKGQLYYTSAVGALVLDLNIIDSIYYDMTKLNEVTTKCKVNVLVITDRILENVPFYLNGHGAVNDIICK